MDFDSRFRAFKHNQDSEFAKSNEKHDILMDLYVKYWKLRVELQDLEHIINRRDEPSKTEIISETNRQIAILGSQLDILVSNLRLYYLNAKPAILNEELSQNVPS